MNKQAVWRNQDRIKVGQQLYDDGVTMKEIKAILAAMPGESMLNVRNGDMARFFADEDYGDRSLAQGRNAIEVLYRDILMQVGPDFPRVHIGNVWPDNLISEVNRWRSRRDMAPVRVVGP